MSAAAPSGVRRRPKISKKVEIRSWRIVIAGIFLVALVAQLALAALVNSRGLINSEEFTPLIVSLLTIYATPLGVMFGSIFAAKNATKKAPVDLVWGVLALSLIWNGLLLGRYLMFSFGMERGDIAHLQTYQEQVVPAGNFLIAAALTYLFGAHTSS